MANASAKAKPNVTANDNGNANANDKANDKAMAKAKAEANGKLMRRRMVKIGIAMLINDKCEYYGWKATGSGNAKDTEKANNKTTNLSKNGSKTKSNNMGYDEHADYEEDDEQR